MNKKLLNRLTMQGSLTLSRRMIYKRNSVVLHLKTPLTSCIYCNCIICNISKVLLGERLLNLYKFFNQVPVAGL